MLALDGKERGLGDFFRAHPLLVHEHAALGQLEFLEHAADGVEVILGRHVEDRVVLVVEAPVGVGRVAVVRHQLVVVIPVRIHVAVRVHRNKAQVLQEARVHAPRVARVLHRHALDQRLLEPRIRALGGKVVHRRGAFTRVDRAAHHDHRARQVGFLVLRHQRHRGEHRHGRLAHRDDVQVRRQQADELAHVVDIVVEVERAGAHRHHAGVDPVGDVHVVVRQHRAHRVAQQSRVVPRKRRHHKDLAVVLAACRALEMDQPAEGLVQRDLFFNRHFPAIDGRRVEAPLGLFVAVGHPQEQVAARGDFLGEWRQGKRAEGMAEPAARQFRHQPHRGQGRVLCFEEAIEQGGAPES